MAVRPISFIQFYRFHYRDASLTFVALSLGRRSLSIQQRAVQFAHVPSVDGWVKGQLKGGQNQLGQFGRKGGRRTPSEIVMLSFHCKRLWPVWCKAELEDFEILRSSGRKESSRQASLSRKNQKTQADEEAQRARDQGSEGWS